MEKTNNDFGLIFWLHAPLLALASTSPLWLDWRLIGIGTLLCALQYFVLGTCFLTRYELGHDNDRTFVWYYLQKVFPNLDKLKTKFIMRILPVCVFGVAIVLQIIIDYQAPLPF